VEEVAECWDAETSAGWTRDEEDEELGAEEVGIGTGVEGVG